MKTSDLRALAHEVGPEVGWTPPTDGEVFLTYVDGYLIYRGDSYEQAARAWDGATFDGCYVGGVAIQQYQNGLCVRDGWLLHVTDEGNVYLNPTWAQH